MGKIDDIRRQRELQYAERQRSSHARKDAVAADQDAKSAKSARDTKSATVERAAKATEPTTVLESTIDKIVLPTPPPPAPRSSQITKPSKLAKPSKLPAPSKVAAESSSAKPARTSKIPSKADARAKHAADAVEAKCPVCGKLRAVKNGVMAEHQKGLGKHCAGSRRKPA